MENGCRYNQDTLYEIELKIEKTNVSKRQYIEYIREETIH